MTKLINRTLTSSGHLRRGLNLAPLSLTTASQSPLLLVLLCSSARLKHLEQTKQSLWRGKKVSTNRGRASKIWESVCCDLRHLTFQKAHWNTSALLHALDFTLLFISSGLVWTCLSWSHFLWFLLSFATSFSALASFLCLWRGTWGCRDRCLSEYDQITSKHENLMSGTQTNIRCWAWLHLLLNQHWGG